MESLDDFAIELQNIVEHCSVSPETEATLVQSVFVAGLKNAKTRETMIRDADHTMNLAQLLEKAKNIEVAAAEAKKMTSKITTDSMNYVDTQRHYSRRPESFLKSPKLGGSRREEISQHRGHGRVDRETVCYNCYGRGHLSYTCTQPKAKKPRPNSFTSSSAIRRKRVFVDRINQLAAAMSELKTRIDDEELESEEELYEADQGNGLSENRVNNVIIGKSNDTTPAFVELKINGENTVMECDTGACVTICSSHLYEDKFSHHRLLPVDQKLSVISGDRICVLGKIEVKVLVDGETVPMSMVVVKSPKNFAPLIGRNWLNRLWPNWRKIFKINSIRHNSSEDQWVKLSIKHILEKFSKVFDDDLSEPVREVTVDIKMCDNAKPFVHKPYTVALKYREKVSEHLDLLESKGILEKVTHAEWASPIVVVVKPNKRDIRVCMDGSKTVNPYIVTHHYPLPLIDELITNKSEAKVFAVIDLRGAYQQLVVSENAKRMLVINTHKGLYAYTRLPFGVKPAAQIFQSVIDRILQGLSNAQAYVDDILIWAKTNEELLVKIEMVLERLMKHNVKVNTEKCQWFVPEVKYLGHILSEAGVSPNPEKVEAIKAVLEPKSTTQLKAFLETIISDNGPPFNSKEFQHYCNTRNITHITSPPYHPASNGLAERAVQTIDNNIKKFLHHHHQTPTTDDGIIPYHRIFAFTPRTQLSTIKPCKNEATNSNELKQAKKTFKEQEKVIHTQKINGRAFNNEAFKQSLGIGITIDCWLRYGTFANPGSFRNTANSEQNEKTTATGDALNAEPPSMDVELDLEPEDISYVKKTTQRE
ncbi:uncharacterized protein K02A2.6-like [Uranotaenia lowii]|uniref:uncharacterized protein K02A2.6-like n=1 Tax=Uranotaenia lowii TaxID=190385 RepID=UPI002479BB3A|nr:uncharacterized protein K02A2.6-like [Uranotaenia lowii]